jgi:hypothetical protein
MTGNATTGAALGAGPAGHKNAPATRDNDSKFDRYLDVIGFDESGDFWVLEDSYMPKRAVEARLVPGFKRIERRPVPVAITGAAPGVNVRYPDGEVAPVAASVVTNDGTIHCVINTAYGPVIAGNPCYSRSMFADEPVIVQCEPEGGWPEEQEAAEGGGGSGGGA